MPRKSRTNALKRLKELAERMEKAGQKALAKDLLEIYEDLLFSNTGYTPDPQIFQNIPDNVLKMLGKLANRKHTTDLRTVNLAILLAFLKNNTRRLTLRELSNITGVFPSQLKSRIQATPLAKIEGEYVVIDDTIYQIAKTIWDGTMQGK